MNHWESKLEGLPNISPWRPLPHPNQANQVQDADTLPPLSSEQMDQVWSSTHGVADAIKNSSIPCPGILGEQVGFSWSNRPCTPDTPKSQMEARAWDPQPNPSSKHNDYTMACDHGHRNPPCRPFSGQLQWVPPPKQWTVYRDGLYAINHGEFIICTQVTVTSTKMGIVEKSISASHPWVSGCWLQVPPRNHRFAFCSLSVTWYDVALVVPSFQLLLRYSTEWLHGHLFTHSFSCRVTCDSPLALRTIKNATMNACTELLGHVLS